MVTKDESLGRSFFGRTKVDRVKMKGIIVLQKMNSMGFDYWDLAYGVFLWFEACSKIEVESGEPRDALAITCT